jgi:hypothetical protein
MIEQAKHSFFTTLGVLSAVILFYPVYHIGSYTCKRIFGDQIHSKQSKNCDCESVLETL